MATEVVVRKWGNSFGVVFPKDFVRKAKLRVEEKVLIDVVREANLKDVFGTLRTKKSGQKFKNEVRAGWN